MWHRPVFSTIRSRSISRPLSDAGRRQAWIIHGLLPPAHLHGPFVLTGFAALEKVPGNHMPYFGMPDGQERAAVVAYLQSLH